MRIDYLCNRKEYISEVSNWVFSEFVKGSGSKSSIEDLKEFFSNTNLDRYPITFVAYNEDECLGTISLFENDLKTQNELKPWLASLYVESQNRNRGIAEELIKSVIELILKERSYWTFLFRLKHPFLIFRAHGFNCRIS